MVIASSFLLQAIATVLRLTLMVPTATTGVLRMAVPTMRATSTSMILLLRGTVPTPVTKGIVFVPSQNKAVKRV